MDKDLAGQVAEIAQRVVASGAISANGHGNVSVRVPGPRRCTSPPAPRCGTTRPPWWCGSGWTGRCWRATCRPSRAPWSPCTRPCTPTIPTSAASCTPTRPTRPPTRSRAGRSGAGSRRWPCSALPDGVPVAGYGPRGSDEAIASIRAAVTPGVPAVLLANHGVLVFHRTPELAILVGSVVEEAAQAGINAGGAGRPGRDPRRHAGRGPAACHDLRQPRNRTRLTGS